MTDRGFGSMSPGELLFFMENFVSVKTSSCKNYFFAKRFFDKDQQYCIVFCGKIAVK